jgi:hypothetical protein
MSEREWERIGSGSGIGFVIAMLVSVFLAPTPPHIDASTTTILGYVGDNRPELLGSAIAGLVAGLLFLVFLGHLRHVLQRSESGAEKLSPLVYGAGLITLAVAYVCTLPLAVLAFGVDSEITANTGLIRLLWDLNALGMATLMVVLALFVATTALAMILGELERQIVGWLGLPVAIVLAAGGVAGYYNSSHEAFWYGLNYVALLAFAAFVLVVAVEGLISRVSVPRESPASSRPLPTT